MKRLQKYFFTGLFVLLPVVLTLKIMIWAFEKLDSILGNFIYHLLHQYFGLNMKIAGLGLVALFVIIILTGLFARNYLGRKIITFGENLLERIPLLNTVYSSLKQITDALALSQTDKGAFRKVVLIEYPREGMYTPGFLIGNAFAEAEEKTGVKMLSVFIPHPPNPTTGFLELVPEEEVIMLDMSVEDGLKMCISIGVIVPEKKSIKQEG